MLCMKKDLHYSNKVLILIIFLNGLSWGQNEYNLENLIFTGERFSKKFSQEEVNGSVFIFVGETKVFWEK